MFDDLSLEDMLREFTQGQYHIAIVRCVEVTEDSDPEYITIGEWAGHIVGVASGLVKFWGKLGHLVLYL